MSFISRQELRRSFFWYSYFEERSGKKVWVSRQSYLAGFVSSFAGIIFIMFVYLTVGAAANLAFSAFHIWLNFFFFFFAILFLSLLVIAAFIFFKDLFSHIVITYLPSGELLIERPVMVRRYLNLFFLRENEVIKAPLFRIEYSKVFYDFLADNSDFRYVVYFVFADGSELRYPAIYATSDAVCSLLDDAPSYANIRFGHFSKIEVEKIAEFFSVPLVYRE